MLLLQGCQSVATSLVSRVDFQFNHATRLNIWDLPVGLKGVTVKFSK